MNYYDEIKEKLIKSEVFDKARDYAKDQNKIKVYFEIGRLLNQAGKEYGKNIIKQYSEKLTREVGKKYNERNLRYMRKFYEVFSNIKWNPTGSKLTWTNLRIMLSLKSLDEVIYYINIAEKNNLSKRQLETIIKSKEYNRIPESTKIKIIKKEKLLWKKLAL